MSKIANFFRSLLGPSKITRGSAQPSLSFRDFTRFAEGDRVLINGVKLLEPLKGGRTTEWKHNIIHDSIIGQSACRLKISSPKGVPLTVEQPSFDQFVSLSPRHVTPIYAPYAAFIVNQLDIHVVPPSPNSPQLEILEAGTGHGSLTLHLARAIAAANPPPPDVEYPRMPQANFAMPATRDHVRLAEAWTEWKKTRNAVIHTVEYSDVHSRAAEKLIRNFRQGLYWPHIDFSVGDVGEWVTTKFQERRNPFLSAVILDVPDVHSQIPRVLPAMQDEATLIVFAASITQLCECEKLIDDQSLHFKQDKVLELGSGISDGRIWNVRLAVPKTRSKSAGSRGLVAPGSSENDDSGEVDVLAIEHPEKVMICRPKVGERLVGGGFIGIWRKMSTSAPNSASSVL